MKVRALGDSVLLRFCTRGASELVAHAFAVIERHVQVPVPSACACLLSASSCIYTD